MSDPVASPRDRTGTLSAALEQWAGQATAPDKATAPGGQHRGGRDRRPAR